MIWVLVSLAILALLVAGVIVSRNRFVRQRNLVRESWQQIDVELHRRYDQVSDLLAAVQAGQSAPSSQSSQSARADQVHAASERTTFDQVDQLRTQAGKAAAEGGELAARVRHEAALTAGLRQLLAEVGDIPDLATSQTFTDLQRQLAETEDRIAAGRRFYNANVRAYNRRVETLPSNLLAKNFGFVAAEYFEIDETDVRAASQ